MSLQTKASPLPFRPWALSLDGTLAFTGLRPGRRDVGTTPTPGLTAVNKERSTDLESPRWDSDL